MPSIEVCHGSILERGCPEDLRGLAVSVREAEMGVVVSRHTPVSELDEAIAKDDAGWIPERPAPQAEVVARVRGVCKSACYKDLSSLTVLVREGEVEVVEGPHAPVAKLNEPVAPRSKFGVAGSKRTLLNSARTADIFRHVGTRLGALQIRTSAVSCVLVGFLGQNR